MTPTYYTSAAYNRLVKIADGIDAHDAVTVGQLNSMMANFHSDIDYDDADKSSVSFKGSHGTRLTNLKEGAITATSTDAVIGSQLANDDKWDFAAGLGHYHSANTVALGIYYHANQDTMFSFGGCFGNENMVNMGLSFKLGHGNTHFLSRSELVQVVSESKESIKLLMETINHMKKEIADLKDSHSNYHETSKVSENQDIIAISSNQ